jgi:hypothetical protein
MRSKYWSEILEGGRLTGDPPSSMPQQIAQRIQGDAGVRSLFGPFLTSSTVLVPVPSSSLKRKGSLSVPDALAAELVRAGLASRVAQLLRRIEAIPKSAYSAPINRSKAVRHFETLAVQTSLSSMPEILLVDDVVTTGATMLGSANRLRASYPDVPIRGFAAMRAMSGPLRFRSVNDPVIGTISLQLSGWCQRRP